MRTPHSIAPVVEFQGLKYPDEHLVRHFFKHGLQNKTGRVLEVGCGNGVNLSVYGHYGWDVTGVDISATAIAAARANLGPLAHLSVADLSTDKETWLEGRYDALLLPSVLYYLPHAAILEVLDKLSDHLSPKAPVYWRMRLMDDYRYGRGEMVGAHFYRLDTPETGEAGAYNRFYTPEDLMAMATDHLGLEDLISLRLKYDNIQNGQLIHNSELIIWGTAP